MRFSQKQNRALVQNDFSVRTQVQLCPRPTLFWFLGAWLVGVFFMSDTCRRLKAPCSGWLTLKLPVPHSPFPPPLLSAIRQLLNNTAILSFVRRKHLNLSRRALQNSRNRAFVRESRHLEHIALVFVCLYGKRLTHRWYDRWGSAGTRCRVRGTHLWRANVLYSAEEKAK